MKLAIRAIVWGAVSAALLLPAALHAAEPKAAGVEALVELDLILAEGAPPTASQRWLPLLAEVGFSQSQVRALQSGDQLEVVSTGTADNPSYRVVGILTRGGDIKLPGREFSFRDRKALSEWVRRLKNQGPETTAGGAMPFGLTPTQLVDSRKDLRQGVAISTRGKDPADVVETLARGLTSSVMMADDVRKTLSESGAIRDELQGLSSGTAIAAIIRPAGLVMRPQFSGGRVQYAILDGKTEGENWPIGWTSDKSPGQLVPGLFEREDTQAVEVPLGPALTELQGRIKAPFVIDYNNLALRGIKLADTQVKMKAGKVHYARVLSRVLSQARMTYETRVDDAGTAFLWITTVKQ
ncbi:MAG: hypothetical protein K8T25_18745 [Planctomycetia bacterium]|nr:hypothetical protein [Planctomycetia bacterium]